MKTTHKIAFRFLALGALLTLSGCLTPNDDGSVPTFGGDTGGTGTTGNSAPTISGNPPAAIKLGDSYSFTPQASDPDGDTLTFSIRNQPGWASFDTSTGTISGVPTLADVGNYPNISVSVSDGQLSASMSGFSIDVTQVATASTTLSWTAPTLNEDGTALTDLAGYKIYYGTASGNYSSQISIDNPSITTYLVENLTPDTYYFAATALNANGVESRYSGEAMKVLN